MEGTDEYVPEHCNIPEMMQKKLESHSRPNSKGYLAEAMRYLRNSGHIMEHQRGRLFDFQIFQQ
uniref:Uncharacterized protein n=1 Tax=Anopheles albimanus TaxID=7167 RepID=A0A182FVI4_ANOAL